MTLVTIMQTLQTLAGGIAATLGMGLFILAAVGMLRFSDPFTRLTAVTKSGTLGVCLILTGVLILDPSVSTGIALGLAIVLQLVTTPIGGLALSRGFFRSGAPLPAMRYSEVERPETHQSS